MLKRIISIFAITLIITGAFFEGYSVRCPSFGATWESCDTLDEQVKAFIAYCKSRDLTIEGSAIDQVTSFTTKAYQNAMQAIGLNVNALQSEIKQATDSNTGMKYLFTVTGASAMNRIFSQFLQDHELEVGDTVDNDIVDTQKGFRFDGGEYAQVWTINGYNFSASTTQDKIISRGNYLVKSSDAFEDLAEGSYKNYKYTVNGTVYQGNCTDITRDTNALALKKRTGNISINGTNTNVQYITTYDNYWPSYVPNTSITGGIIVFVDSNTGYLYFGNICLNMNGPSTGDKMKLKFIRIQNKTQDNVQTTNVYITTNNNIINNNTYNNNTYTVINNDGDVYNYNDGDDEPDPDTPVVPDPDPDPPNPDLPSGNGWDDFQLPDMPNDWLIYGMENKFPFDIPFNIMFALSLLNHDPVTPHFVGDINLRVCTWHYDIDLSPFDDIAAIVRKFEVLAFIIGLAIMTKNLINWG